MLILLACADKLHSLISCTVISQTHNEESRTKANTITDFQKLGGNQLQYLSKLFAAY